MPLAQANEAPASVDWVVAFGPRQLFGSPLPHEHHSFTRDLSFHVRGHFSRDGSTQHARSDRFVALFDGVLYNRSDLEHTLQPTNGVTDAGLILLAYERWGRDLLHVIKGIFTLVVWDSAEGHLFAGRDPLGLYPLFYANVAEGGLLLSMSIESLLADPRVSRALNRAALADQICQRWPDVSETFFESVKRVPAGHWLVSDGRAQQVTRYWNPLPTDEPIKWVSQTDLEDFDRRLEVAVERTLRFGPAGVFLSGGLDSTAVATVATDVANRFRCPLPVALSLRFPDPCDEGPIQQSVASTLGLAQEIVPFWMAIPPGTMLTNALNLSRTLSAPLRSPWSPAYHHLVERAKRRGVRVILSGLGGDELLGANALYAADLIRSGNIVGLAQHVATWNRSYRFTPLPLLKSVLWTFGVRPLGVSLAERFMPRSLNARRVRRSMRFAPGFVAPDESLRTELERRTASAFESAGLVPGTPYLRDLRRQIDHSMMSAYLEESFERGRRLGVKFLHPLWDADLADMLYRTPQPQLYGDGRAKYLVRRMLSKRFPELGLDRQKKLAATPFFRSALASELPGVWRSMAAVPTLASLGVVDADKARQTVEVALRNGDRRSLGGVWELLKLEAWASSRI